MRRLRAWATRILALLGGARDDDFDAELASHLQLHVDDNVRAGMSPGEARRHALIRLGGVQAVREQHRDRRGVPVVQHLGRDLRYAARTLRRQPTFAVVTVMTLALGIGANTSIFTLVNAVFLNPLPYPDPDRLAIVWGTETSGGAREVSISFPDFEAWQQQARSFERMAAFTSRAVTLGNGDQLELVPGVQTTTQFFAVLGVDAVAGRTFTGEDAAPDAQPVAVLSDAASRRLFPSERDAIGRTVSINHRPHTVIGIVPASMHIIPTEHEDVYSLLPRETDRQHGYLRTLARLSADASFESAQSEMNVIAGQLAAEFPRSNAGTGARVVPLTQAGGTPVRDALLLLLALVGAVLLIACTNVANLLLARNAARHQELALRVSLGASRGRILQQLFVEALLLVLCGGLGGLLVAQIVTDLLLALLEGAVPMPRLERVRLDATVLAFTAGVSILTGVLFGVVPALVAAPRRVKRAAQSARSVAGSRGARRTRAALVILETALALVLLAAAAMLARSFVELRGTPPGFVADDVLAVGVRLPASAVPGPPRAAFFEQLRGRLEGLPHVASAGFVSSLPLGGGSDSLQFRVSDRPGAKPTSASFNVATPGYFATMRIPVLAGREFTAHDSSTAPSVIVINETAARRFWPDVNPLGRQIVLTGQMVPLTVVGVSGDVRQSSLGVEPRPEIYLNGLQPGPDWSSFALVVRAADEATTLAADVRAALRQVNRDVAIAKIAPMSEVVAGSVAQPRIYTALIGGFAALAVLLAAVGLYGVMSYSVAQQTKELGIRLALGSTPSGIVFAVLRQGTLLTIGGIALGATGAYLATRAMAKLLPGARGEDPAAVALVALLMVIVGAAASFVPARRASRVDPLAALRVE